MLALRSEAGLTGQSSGADSDAALGLFLIQKERSVQWAGEIAGHPPGVLETNRMRLLITRGPNLIDGVDGDASPLVEFLSDLLGREAEDPCWRLQLETFVGWLKQGRAAIRNPADGLSGGRPG